MFNIPEVELEAVSVSAPFIHHKKFLAPSSVAILNSTDLLQNSSLSLVDQLGQIPGITAQSGTFNTVRISIRGIGSRTPYGTNRIKAYLDDIPLTTGEGYSQLEDLDPAFISSVYLTKGAKSALFGSGLGGVLMLGTKQQTNNGLSITAGMEGGPYQTMKPFILLGMAKKGITFTTGYALSNSRGWRENSAYTRHNLFAVMKLSGERSVISALAYFINTRTQIPSSLNEEMFIGSPQLAAPNWLAVEGFEQYSRLLSGISHTFYINRNWQLSTSLSVILQDGYESRPFNILDDNSSHMTLKSMLGYQSMKFAVRLGAEGQLDSYDWSVYETMGGEPGLLAAEFTESRLPVSIFLKGDWQFGTSGILESAISYNLLNYSIEDRFSDSTDLSDRFSFKPVLSPFIGVNLPLGKAFRFYASFGHGISYPDVEETLLPDYRINTGLKPESGTNLEVGVRGEIWEDIVFTDLSLYRMDVKNMLVTKRETEDVFYGVNLGKSLHQGVELSGRYYLLGPPREDKPEAFLSFGIEFGEHKFKDFIDDGNDFSGNYLPGVPAAVISGNFRFDRLRGFFGTLNGRWVQQQYLNDANTGQYNRYVLASVKFGYEFSFRRTSSLILYCGVNNLFNTRFASMILVNAPSFDGAPPRYYYPGTPRYVYAGMKFSFKNED
ncbi:MAG: TonB-dependent receptor [Bacteroidales bacterium]|nr:TonB-dependent receptor [Bacteroidales bacterium]